MPLDLTAINEPPELWRQLGAPGEPVLLNGWSNLGGEWETAAFYRDGRGRACLRGLITGGTVANSASGNIFTLPAGYRPALREMFSTVAITVATSTLVVARLDVLPTGEVRAVEGGLGSFSLSGISFRVALV